MSYVIFGLNVPLLGMNRTCLEKITHVWNLLYYVFKVVG